MPARQHAVDNTRFKAVFARTAGSPIRHMQAMSVSGAHGTTNVEMYLTVQFVLAIVYWSVQTQAIGDLLCPLCRTDNSFQT